MSASQAEYCGGMDGGEVGRPTQHGLYRLPGEQGWGTIAKWIGGGQKTKTTVALQKQNDSCSSSVDFG